jgi:hypothetical protein
MNKPPCYLYEGWNDEGVHVLQLEDQAGYQHWRFVEVRQLSHDDLSDDATINPEWQKERVDGELVLSYRFIGQETWAPVSGLWNLVKVFHFLLEVG